MNKIFATIVLAAFALSGCIKEDDSYKELLPLRPGMNIYSLTMTQNSIAMQPANAGIRLAMLAAEAKAQNKEVTAETLSGLTYEKTLLKTLLFGAESEIEEVEGGFKITYSENIQQADGFFLKGSMLVRTNGVEQLKDATNAPEAQWLVEPQGLKVISFSQYGNRQTANIDGGTTILYHNGGGSYTIEMSGIGANLDDSSNVSDWNGEFYLSGTDADLVYSKCRGKDFKLNGEAGGGSIYVFTDNSQLRLGYELTGGVYRGHQIIEGTQECSFKSYNYDTAAYPSPDVRYVWSNSGGSPLTLYQKIYYNGYVYPKN